MNTVGALAASAGLGIAGLDPVGALLIIPSVLKGTRRRVIALFPLFTVVVTVVTGLVLGESIGAILDWFRRTFSFSDTTRGVLQIVVAVPLLAWAIRRWAKRNEPEAPKTRKSPLEGPLGLSLLGVFWGVSAVTDPSFLALAAIAAGRGAVEASGLYLVWVVVSQLPLFILMLALVAGRNSHPVQRAMDWAGKLMKPADSLLTVLLGLGAVLLVANVLTYFVGGEYWPV